MKKPAVLCAMVMALCFFAAPALAAEPVSAAGKTVALPGGGERKVTAIQVDLTDPNIRIFSVHAQNRVGATAALKDIAAQVAAGGQYEVIAAVNGTFFDAYTTGVQRGMGTVISNGQMIYKLDGTFIGFGADNRVKMDWIHLECIGYVDGVHDRDYSFYIHNWNRILPATESYRETLLTPAFGATCGDTDMNVAVVVNDVIQSVTKGDTAIPANGYLYLFPDDSAYNDGRFQAGRSVEYEKTFYNRAQQVVDWSGIDNITGVGPTLVKGGAKTADAAAEGWTDPKLTSQAGQRSFIGFDSSGAKLTIGTVGDCTISQLGDVALGYGLFEAMNLDGGASSGLLYNGNYLTAPGRNLSNAIVVARVKNAAAPAAPPASAAAPLTDAPSSWAAEAVKSAAAAGLVPTANNLHSAYNKPIVRGDFCALAVALYEKLQGEISERAAFSDTEDVNVQKLAGLGVVGGMGEGKFSPGAALTREQAATILAKLAAAMDKPLPQGIAAFTDGGQISAWARESVGQVQAAGIMGGVGDNRFEPKNPYTLEQSIVTIWRLYTALQ